MLAPQSKLPVIFGVGSRNHSAITSAQELPRMHGETRDRRVRATYPLPSALPIDLASNGAGGVFYDRKVVFAGETDDCVQIAWHAKLVDAEDRACLRVDHPLDQRGVDVESFWLDIDKNRNRITVTHAVGRRDVGVADGN